MEHHKPFEFRGVHHFDLVGSDHNSMFGVSDTVHPGVFVRSVDFQNPGGISPQFACWTRDLDQRGVAHAPDPVVARVDA